MSPVCSKDLRRATVAVIGAGPAGLAVARELKREGHSVTIFEAGDGVGGAWRFDAAATDSDLLGLDGSRFRVHSSMYPGLRTNLPRHLMSLCDFPFSTEMLGGRAQDTRAYPLHTEVLAFCEALAEAAGLRQHLVPHTRVLRVDPVLPSNSGQLPASQPLCQHQNLQWRVVTATECPAAAAGAAAVQAVDEDGMQQPQQQPPPQQAGQDDTQQQQQLHQQLQEGCSQEQGQTDEQQEWVFDAVASCVGTFSEISLPQVPGMELWPGIQLHSHNYRGAAQFKGQKVVVVGASFSGEEIARHVAKEAREVLHCARTFTGPGTARQQSAPAVDHTSQQPAAQRQVHLQDQGSVLSIPGHLSQPHLPQLQQPLEQQAPSQQQPQLQQPLEQQQGEIPPAPEPRPNITRLPMLAELRPDGSALLAGGQVVQGLDAVVYCTGYKYTLPWLDHLGLVQTDNGCVRPLFMHMFVPSVGPSLALCGLPWRCAKFPQFQLQGQLLARLLSGRAALPPQHGLEQEQQQLFDTMQAQGIPQRYTHCMGSFMPTTELAYAEQLVRLAAGTLTDCQHNPSSDTPASQHCQHTAGHCQQPAPSLIQMPHWMADMAKATAGSILGRPDTFRDTWSEGIAALMAEADKAMRDLYERQLVSSSRPTSSCSHPL